MLELALALRSLPRSGRALAAGFVALAAFLMASVLFSVQQHGDDALLRHALEVEVDLGDLQAALLGAEVGQRDYLLTEDAAFLKPYDFDGAGIDTVLDRLGKAVRRDPGQSVLFGELRDAVQKRRAELARTLAPHDGGDSAGAVAVIRSRTGMDLTRDIHERVNRMDVEQDRLLAERREVMAQLRIETLATTALSLVLMGLVAFAALAEVRKRARLAPFLPAEVATRLADGEMTLRDGRSGPATVVFVDIRSFTSLAEGLSPKALSTLLTAFRRDVSSAARRHGGMVDKFIGDGALVVFGAVEARDDAARDALAFAAALTSGPRKRRQPDGRFRIGIGIHHGDVFCMIVGASERQEFTVLGDTVNVAARFEEATKAFGTELLVSEIVLQAARADLATWRKVSRAPLRGRSESLPLYAPVDGPVSNDQFDLLDSQGGSDTSPPRPQDGAPDQRDRERDEEQAA